MQPKFTSGPWSWKRWGSRDIDVGAEGAPVASVHRWADGETDEANAALISAAPNMYDALADCIVSLCAANLEHLPSLAKARAALAKAEGRDAR